jgi:hypothetical protein
MSVSEVIIEDYSDITRIRGRTLSKVTLRFFDQQNSRHQNFLASARVATRHCEGVVIVEQAQPIFYVQGS